MDNNGSSRRKLKVSIFDFIIIAVAIVAVLVVMRVFSSGSVSSAETTTVRYTVTLRELPVDLTGLISPGDELVDGIRNYKIGTVTGSKIRPSMREATDLETGNVYMSEYAGRYDAEVYIEAQAQESDSDIVVGGGYTVKVGLEAAIKGPGYGGTGFITHIERGEG